MLFQVVFQDQNSDISLRKIRNNNDIQDSVRTSLHLMSPTEFMTPIDECMNPGLYSLQSLAYSSHGPFFPIPEMTMSFIKPIV